MKGVPTHKTALRQSRIFSRRCEMHDMIAGHPLRTRTVEVMSWCEQCVWNTETRTRQFVMCDEMTVLKNRERGGRENEQ